MNEEEIIEIIEELMCLYKEQMNCDKYYNEIVERSTRNFKALQSLLDLYNKEKEKNNSISIQYEKVVDKIEDLEQIEQEHKEENGRLREENKILRHGLEENTEEIDKLYKIINEMAEDLMHIGSIPYRENIFTKEQLIKQYVNKVEEDK